MATERVITAAPTSRHFKVTAVGDVEQGQKDLLGLNSSGRNTTSSVTVDGVTYTVTLTDTGGMEELDRLQPAVYRDTNCFLLCYSEKNKESLENVESKWWPEVRSVGPSVPVVLVACKSQSDTEDVYSDGLRVKRSIGAFALCSYDGHVDDVLREAVDAIPGRQPRDVKHNVIINHHVIVNQHMIVNQPAQSAQQQGKTKNNKRDDCVEDMCAKLMCFTCILLCKLDS